MKKIRTAIACVLLSATLAPLSGCTVVWELKGVNSSFVESGTGITGVQIDYDHANFKVRFDKNAEQITISYPTLYNHRNEAVSVVTLEETETTLTLTEDDGGIADAAFKIGEYELPQLTLILPADRVYDLSLATAYGTVELQGAAELSSLSVAVKTGEIHTAAATLTSERVSLTTDTGGICVGAITANEIALTTEIGAIVMEKKVSAVSLTATTNYGEIKVNRGAQADTVTFTTRIGGINALFIGAPENYSVEIFSGTLTGENSSETDTGAQVTLKSMVGAIRVEYID